MNLRTRSMTDVDTQSTRADAASLAKIKTSILSPWIPKLCSKQVRINHDCPPNCSMFYTKIFEFGLQIPCDPFIPNLLESLRLAPSQLTPNAWAYLLAFVRLCDLVSKPNLVNVFLFFFEIGPITSGLLPCFYFFLPRKEMKKILPGSDSSIHQWKKPFLFIKQPASCPNKFSSKWGIIPDEFLQNPTLSTEDQAVVESILGINQSFFLKSFAQGKPIKECEKAAKEFLERTQKGKAAAKLVPNKRKTQAEKMKELAHKLALEDEESDDDNDAGEEEEYLRSEKKQIAPMLMSTFSLPASSTDHFASGTEVDDDSFRSQLYEQVTVAIEPPVEDWDSKSERECVTAIDANLSRLVNIMKAVGPRFCAQGDKISEYNTELVKLRGIMMKKESDLSLSEAKAHGMEEKLKKQVDELMKRKAVDDNATIDRLRARKNKYKQDVLLVGANMMKRAAILFADKFPLEDVNAILVLDGQPPLKRRLSIEEYDKQQAAKEMEVDQSARSAETSDEEADEQSS